MGERLLLAVAIAVSAAVGTAEHVIRRILRP